MQVEPHASDVVAEHVGLVRLFASWKSTAQFVNGCLGKLFAVSLVEFRLPATQVKKDKVLIKTSFGFFFVV